MKRTGRARLFSLFLAFAPILPAHAAAPADEAAGSVVEKARYIFGWNGVTAAVAEFTLSVRFSDGPPTFLFDGRARTTEAIDLFWRMRDSVHAVVDGRTLSPRRFSILRHENSNRSHVELVNDTVEEKLRIRRTTKKGRIAQGSVPSEDLYDPVSAMLLLRQKRLHKGDTETVRVLEGKRVYFVTVRSLGRDKIQLGSKSVRAIKLRLHYRSEDGRRSSEEDGISQTHIWVADEPTHEILRLEAESGLGTIFGERVEAKGT